MGASGTVAGCSLVSSVFSLGRVQRARSRIRTPAGQHYSVGRRKRHFEVTLDPTPAPTNYMKKHVCLSPSTCHAALIANSPSHNFNYCAIFSISIYPKTNWMIIPVRCSLSLSAVTWGCTIISVSAEQGVKIKLKTILVGGGYVHISLSVSAISQNWAGKYLRVRYQQKLYLS